MSEPEAGPIEPKHLAPASVGGGGLSFDPLALVSRLIGMGGHAPPMSPKIEAATVRLMNAQARALEVQFPERELPTPLLEALPGRFDLVVMGKKGSGKTRLISKLVEYARLYRLDVELVVAEWPEAKPGHLVVVDDAQVPFGPCLNRDSKESARLRDLLSRTRQNGLATVWCVQHPSQCPVWLLRHDVWIITGAVGWISRRLARGDLSDRLDAAHEHVRVGGRGVYGLVDGDGWAQAVCLDGM